MKAHSQTHPKAVYVALIQLSNLPTTYKSLAHSQPLSTYIYPKSLKQKTIPPLIYNHLGAKESTGRIQYI